MIINFLQNMRYKRNVRKRKEYFDGVLNCICIKKRKYKKINFSSNDKIPLLAWCLEIKDDSTEINYGSGVYKHNNGIVEGVWDGNFDDLNYASATHVFGTGVTITEQSIIVTPNSHMYEGLFLLYDKEENRLYFSNSLSYALAKYEKRIEDLEKLIEDIRINNDKLTATGVLKFNPLLFDDQDMSVYCFYYHNIVISNNGIKVEIKDNQQNFKNFNEYKNYLLHVLKLIINNGTSKSRNIILDPISSISKGYDSPAVTSLLQLLGVKESVTADVDVYGRNDSGAEISEVLGLKCFSCKHPAGRMIEDLNMNYSEDLAQKAQEFIATPGLGDDIVFLSFDKFMENRMLFTGALGDSIWNIHSKIPDGIPVRVPFGKSLNEYRIRKGFSHIPVPTIGAVFSEDIFKINSLDEMKAYSVGGDYDRPIPRRISEESGIPRLMFGNAKTATNPNPLNLLEYKKGAFEKQILKYK